MVRSLKEQLSILQDTVSKRDIQIEQHEKAIVQLRKRHADEIASQNELINALQLKNSICERQLREMQHDMGFPVQKKKKQKHCSTSATQTDGMVESSQGEMLKKRITAFKNQLQEMKSFVEYNTQRWYDFVA